MEEAEPKPEGFFPLERGWAGRKGKSRGAAEGDWLLHRWRGPGATGKTVQRPDAKAERGSRTGCAEGWRRLQTRAGAEEGTLDDGQCEGLCGSPGTGTRFTVSSRVGSNKPRFSFL